uniref:claudin-7-like n=1 Tax=Myxine glutinosa TaxID=7769 RepID=UPI00358E1A04
MVSSSCQVLACALCFVALVGFTISTAHPEWKITSRGAAVVVVTFMYQGLWMNCAGNSMGSQQCKRHYTILNLPVHIQVCQALMIISMILSILGITVSLLGLKCSRLSGDDENVKCRIVAIGGIMNFLAGLTVITLISYYAWQITMDFYSPELGAKYEYGVALYIGWAASVLALAGGAMLFSSTNCCAKSTPAPKYTKSRNSTKASIRSYNRNSYV